MIFNNNFNKTFRFRNFTIVSEKGFSLLEIVVSLAILSLISIAIISFLFWMNVSNSKTKADREAGENARAVLDQITSEIRAAKSVYTPTTAASQLSLETARYLPPDETSTFIDFFLCAAAICLKKESQNPIALTSDSVQVTSLTFTQIANGAFPSVKVNLTVSYPNADPNASALINLTSTASLRSY